ncbi:MAG: helix-turn-helix domain-containing protein [Gammaproteobacteria bacterium]|nr:helix-turn-helix domain-containing protein [Gammaproteobacteria bacterium]
MSKHDYLEPFDGICPDCGGRLESAWQETEYVYGEGEESQRFPVELPVHTCVNCGFDTLSVYANKLRHEALCRHLGALSPREIRDIREGHGLSRAEFSELTGIGEASLGRWERGEGVQSLAYDRYLRLLSIQDGIYHLKSVVPMLKDSLVSRDETSDEPEQNRFPGLADIDTSIGARIGFRLMPVTKTT